MRAVRAIAIVGLLLGACARGEPVQDPLDYLRIGVDPAIEAQLVMRDLEREGYTIGRRVETSRYYAFEAARGPDTTVRVLTYRGPAFSATTPDVRAPHRAAVALGSNPWPDYDRDGLHDVTIAVREPSRTCLSWLAVDEAGFVSEVFRPKPEWGDAPCVLHIDPTWPRLLLEVTVPDQPNPEARVRLPIYAPARGWALDESPSAAARWEREISQREVALGTARARGDTLLVARLEAELAWLERLHEEEETTEGDEEAEPAPEAEDGVPKAKPVLEAAEDGEKAR